MVVVDTQSDVGHQVAVVFAAAKRAAVEEQLAGLEMREERSERQDASMMLEATARQDVLEEM
jgi:hypothetical protein